MKNQKEKLTITSDDLITIGITVELLGTAKEKILDMQTIDALITPSDILALIKDLHSCAYNMKNVYKKLRLISGEVEK